MGEVFLTMWNLCFVIYQKRTPSRHSGGVEKGHLSQSPVEATGSPLVCQKIQVRSFQFGTRRNNAIPGWHGKKGAEEHGKGEDEGRGRRKTRSLRKLFTNSSFG